MGSPVGIPKIEIEGDPRLSERYSIMTANPDSVRFLMNRNAIDSLLTTEVLHLRNTRRWMLASR